MISSLLQISSIFTFSKLQSSTVFPSHLSTYKGWHLDSFFVFPMWIFSHFVARTAVSYLKFLIWYMNRPWLSAVAQTCLPFKLSSKLACQQRWHVHSAVSQGFYNRTDPFTMTGPPMKPLNSQDPTPTTWNGLSVRPGRSDRLLCRACFGFISYYKLTMADGRDWEIDFLTSGGY